MRIKTLSLVSAAMLCVTAMPASAQIAGIDAMKEWNLIVLGDLQSSSEVEGRTFVGGNLTGNSSNYQIKTPATSALGTPGLTVVGDVNGGHKNLNNGSGAIVGGNVNSGFNLNGATQTVKVGGAISNTNVNQNVVQSGLGTSDPAFLVGLNQQKSVLTTSMGRLSTDMKGLDANSQLTISGNRGTFNAQPDNKGVAVFNIAAADLDKIGEIQFNLNGADTAIVNVSGTNINLNDNFLGGTTGLGEHVIWNFADATSLKSTTAWGGSVLAPNAAANTGNYIEGSAVFGSLVQNGEFHLGTYTGGYTSPVTPPGGGGGPSPIPGETLGLFALGAAGLIGLRWRRKRKEAAAA
ncbi:MAG: choice-of-anchor A family protein [Pseudomonadota bacterium]